MPRPSRFLKRQIDLGSVRLVHICVILYDVSKVGFKSSYLKMTEYEPYAAYDISHIYSNILTSSTFFVL